VVTKLAMKARSSLRDEWIEFLQHSRTLGTGAHLSSVATTHGTSTSRMAARTAAASTAVAGFVQLSHFEIGTPGSFQSRAINTGISILFCKSLAHNILSLV